MPPADGPFGALPGGLGRLHDARRMSGGAICRVWRGRLDDGTAVVVKYAPYDVAVEVDGLRALAAGGAPVPEILASADQVLVLSCVGGTADWRWLGRQIAGLHSRERGDQFGWHRDNLLGRAVQRGGWSADWPQFLVEQRLRPLLRAGALESTVRARLLRAFAGPLPTLLGAHDPRPSLIHGDLWHGNIISGRWLVDPAVWLADRELELAYATLFGGIPQAFFAAYAEAWPLPPGATERLPAMQLYHLLIHVWHFGARYVPMVVERLDALGWR